MPRSGGLRLESPLPAAPLMAAGPLPYSLRGVPRDCGLACFAGCVWAGLRLGAGR